MELDGARCLVTGCSSGIGRSVATLLAAAEAEVWATARVPETLHHLDRIGINTARVDVRSRQEIEDVVEAMGRVDVLVNNAGYGLEGAVEEVSDDELLDQYDTNVFGIWRACRAVLPGMRERGRGVIVNISSFGGQAPYPGIGAYRSSKFAVEGLSWTLDLEVAHFGIRVIDVQPGLVESAFESKMKRARAVIPAYEPMRRSAARAYPRMSPAALPAEAVATAIVTEIQCDVGPLHLRIGEDAERMVCVARAGDAAFERYLVCELGFDWHPAREP